MTKLYDNGLTSPNNRKNLDIPTIRKRKLLNGVNLTGIYSEKERRVKMNVASLIINSVIFVNYLNGEVDFYNQSNQDIIFY